MIYNLQSISNTEGPGQHLLETYTLCDGPGRGLDEGLRPELSMKVPED